MNITVLFTCQKYRQYFTVQNFINDLSKQMWGELDVHQILWEGSIYDLRHFLFMVTSDKIKADFFALLDETTYKVVISLLERLLILDEEKKICLLRDALFSILEDEVFFTCGEEGFDENLQKLDQIKEYLDCFYFDRT